MAFELLGVGMCRGEGWQRGRWPIGRGERSLQECANACAAKAGCTAFDLSHQYGEKDHEDECLLYGHKKVAPASGVPGRCYVVVDDNDDDEADGGKGGVEKSGKIEKGKRDKREQKVRDEKPKREKAKEHKAKDSATSKPASKKKAEKEPKKVDDKKAKKVPKFKPPKVIDDDDDEDDDDDDEWLFEPPPPEVRSREHIAKILELNKKPNPEAAQNIEKTLKELKRVYEGAVKPLEGIYKYRELSNRHFGDPEIFGKPLVVLMGPYSGGKSTMINYLLGTEFTPNAFKSGENENEKKKSMVSKTQFFELPQ